MKTRLICAVCLLLCLLTALPLASCAVNKPSGAVGSTTDGSGSDPRRAEELAVKTAALKILNSYNDAEDPASVFDFFKRGFELTDFEWKNFDNPESAELTRVYVTGDYTIQTYGDPENSTYRLPYGEGIVEIGKDEEGRLCSSESLIGYRPDFLSFFGITAPSASSEKDGLELPELISDKLTVSPDLKICALPSDFLTAYAEYMAKSVDETAGRQDGSKFEIKEISGIYNAGSDSVEISFKASVGGEIMEQESSIIGDIGNGGKIVSKVKTNVTQNHVTVPVEITTEYSDLKFVGNTPVSAKISVKTASSSEYRAQGVTYRIDVNDERVFAANVENAEKPVFSYSASSKTAINGKGSASTVENVSISCGGDGYALEYDYISNTTPVIKYSAKLIFDPKDVPALPEEVIDLIEKPDLPET